MKLFKDALTGDELLSDVFKLKEVDDIFYEVEGKIETESTSIDESKLGANKSAEDTGDDDVNESGVTGINIVLRHKLQEVGGEYFEYKKKDYKVHIKKYMKKISDHLQKEKPARVPEFQKSAQAAIKKILEKFDDFQFFRGESTDPDLDEGECMLVLAEYRDNIPYMLFFKDGLEEEKV